jgi:hypothetical protein
LRKGVNFLGIFAKWMLTELACLNIILIDAPDGRIYKAVSHAPREAPWFWGLDFFEWQGSDEPQYGNVASLEAAKHAFRAAWDRRPKASGKD